MGYEYGERVYMDDPDFDAKLLKSFTSGELCKPDTNRPREKNIEYFDTVDFFKEKIQYYLYYVLDDCCYYKPIKKEEVDKYQSKYHLSIIRITDTHVRRYRDDIYPLSFVDEVIHALEISNKIHDMPEYQDDLVMDYETVRDCDIDKNVPYIQSQNIEYSISAWGGYLENMIEEHFSWVKDEDETSELFRDEIINIKMNYASRLDAEFERIVKREQKRIKKLRNRLLMAQKTQNTKELEETIRAIHAYEKKSVKMNISNKEYDYNEDFLEYVFYCCDVFDINYNAMYYESLDELEEFYIYWYIKNNYGKRVRDEYYQKNYERLRQKCLNEVNESKRLLLAECERLSQG